MLAFVFTLGLVGSASAATTTVDLGTADNFAVLAGSAITNTGATTIAGDVGSSPTPTETGFGTVTFTSGTNHTSADPNDATTQAAKVALTAAYTDAAGRTPATTIASDLGTFLGGTLLPGVYNSGSSIGLTGTLTLDAQGDPNAVWIFQAGSTLTTASASSVSLVHGAQACNVFWQIGSSATLGTNTNFKGTIMALASITDDGGSTINGRLLARTAAVTLNHTTITAQNCSATVAAASAEAATYTTAQTAAAQTAAAQVTAAQTAAAAAARLPSTGVTPTHSNVPLNIAIVASVFALSTLFVLIRRKKII